MTSSGARFLALGITLTLLIPTTISCGGRRAPDLAQVFASARTRAGKRPIILVPGILNLALVNSKTSETVWPRAFRSDSDDLDLPITGDPLNSKDDLVATEAIESARFLPLTPKVNILGDLLQALRTHAGYTEGNWEKPAADGDRDTFYTFVYDWRRDNVQSAQQLIKQLDSLKQKLHRPDLRFNVVAVSMGGLIARYAAMYGAAELPSSGNAPVVTWAGASHIAQIFMFGVPNEGSMSAFATILNGYSLTEGTHKPRHLLRKLSRQDAFSGLSVFQLMPHKGTARFLDQNLKPVTVDLYDPVNWKLYGWSIAHDPEFRKRFAREKSEPELAHNHSAVNVLDIHLATILARTKLFHEALDAPVKGPAPVQLLAFVGDCDQTLNAAILFHDKKRERWITITSVKELRSSEGTKLNRSSVIEAMYVPGDGRVTRASVMGEHLEGMGIQSPYQTVLPIAHAFFACGGHGSLQNNTILQNNALSVLVNEVVKLADDLGPHGPGGGETPP
jgi:lecithin:cholesterol acyltransferase